MDIKVQDGDVVVTDGELWTTPPEESIQQQIQHFLYTKPGTLMHNQSFGFDLHEIFNFVVPVSSEIVASTLSQILSRQLTRGLVHGVFQSIETEHDEDSVKAVVTVNTPSGRLAKKIVKFNISSVTQEVL